MSAWNSITSHEEVELSTAIEPMTRYEISPHPITAAGTFSSLPEIILEELAIRRNNAHTLFVYIAPEQPYASDVRTWPHHFDTGLYLPIRKNDAQKDLNSIGLGMAPLTVQLMTCIST